MEDFENNTDVEDKYQLDMISEIIGDVEDDAEENAEEKNSPEEEAENEEETSERENISDTEEEREEENETAEDEETSQGTDDEEKETEENDEEEKTEETSGNEGNDGDEGSGSSEIIALQKQNQMLLERIDSLIKEITKEKESNISTDNDKTDTENAIEDFLGDMDIDDVSSDKELFNKVLTKVASKIEKQVEEKYKNIYQDIEQINNRKEVEKMVDIFYKENPDLAGVKTTVQAVATDIIKNNSDKSLKEIFNMAADGTRKMLGIKKQKEVIKNKKNEQNPALVKKSQNVNKVKKTVKKSKLQSEIDSLL